MMSCQEIRVPRGVFNCRMGGDEAGFPVVALHGWPESSYCWEPLARRLDPGLRCIAPDLRGLGIVSALRMLPDIRKWSWRVMCGKFWITWE